MLRSEAGSVLSREKLVRQLRSPLYRNALYLIASQVTTGIVGFVFWIVAARLYSTEEVGLGSATISAMMLLSNSALLGLDYAAIRFLPDSGDTERDLVNTCLTITGIMALAVAPVFVAGVGVWSAPLVFLRGNLATGSVFVAFVVMGSLRMFLMRAFVARRRAGFTLAQGIVFNLTRIALLGLFARFSGTFGIYGSWGVSHVIAAVTSAVLFLPRVLAGYRPLPKLDRGVIRRILPYSLANYGASLLWLAPMHALPLIVVNRLGAEDNAYFYIAWAVVAVLFIIPMAISYSLLAEGSHDERQLSQNARRSLLFSLSLLLPGILLLVTIGDRMLALFNPEYAEEATGLLRILAASAIPLAINQIYFGVRRAQRRMKGVVVLTAVSALATLALSWVLLPRMGIDGAGIAWLSGQGAVALAVIFLWSTRA